MHFTGGILTPVNSGTITLSAGDPAQLAFTVQPSDASVGGTITPAVEVEIQDGAGNHVTAATNAVTVALDINPTDANLGGTKTVSAVGGVATFSTLTVDEAGTGYTLSATATSLAADESASFDIGAATTTTTITSDLPDPSEVGEVVTVQFSVASSGGIPTGNVTVSAAGGSETCVALVAIGECEITLLDDGSRTLTATYGGDGDFSGSVSDPASHTVNLAATTTTITSDAPDPSVVGGDITVSFDVSTAFGTATGNVTVSDGVDSCIGTVADGSCTLTLTTVGARTITATYEGDATHGASSSTGESHTVDPAPTTTTITDNSPNTSLIGQDVTVTFTVTSSFGTPTGMVTVSDGVDSCSATVAAGSCSLALNTIGLRTLTASYEGDSAHESSISPGVGQTVL
jgi:hypothetical protein